MISISEIKERGKAAFRANYWKCVLGALVMLAATSAGGSSRGSSSGSDIDEFKNMSDVDFAVVAALLAAVLLVAVAAIIVSIVVGIFVRGALEVGCRKFFMENGREHDPAAGIMFDGFKYGYLHNTWIMFLKGLYTGLWSLLFIIPGIVKAYEYRMVPYILADNPDIDAKEAFARSKEMMMGYKGFAFGLDASFIGWWIVELLTLGIAGLFWVNPYYFSACAELYIQLNDSRDDSVNGIEYIQELSAEEVYNEF